MYFYIIGAGGFSSEILSVFEASFDNTSNLAKIVLVDPNTAFSKYLDWPIIKEISAKDLHDRNHFCVSISKPSVRKKLADYYLHCGLTAKQLVSKKSEIYKNTFIGDGSIVLDQCIISANSKIGRFTLVNSQSYIGHDCDIGSFVTISPRAVICGNVIIEDGAYIGAGALIRNGNKSQPLVIGRDATVGMGAVVLQDVPQNKTVVGNPAREISS